MPLDLFGEIMETILRAASNSATPLGLLEVHRIAHYRAFQPSTGGRFQLEKEALSLESNIQKTLR
jgi:hypothetical protein